MKLTPVLAEPDLAPIEPPQPDPAPESGADAEIDRFTIEENDDGSVSFTLADGTPIVLRDLITEDIIKVEQFAIAGEAKVGNTAVALKLISLLCIQWGDKKKVTYGELAAKPLRKFGPELKRFNKVFEYFRLEDLLS